MKAMGVQLQVHFVYITDKGFSISRFGSQYIYYMNSDNAVRIQKYAAPVKGLNVLCIVFVRGEM